MTTLGAEHPKGRVSIPDNIIYFLQNVQTGCGAYSASDSAGTGSYFTGGVNHFKPTVYAPPSLTFKNSTFRSQCLFMHFVRFPEQTAITALPSIN